MHVGVIAVPGTFGSSFTSVIDIVRTAEALRPSVDRGIAPLTTTIVGMRPSVRASAGLVLEAERDLTDPTDDLDVLVVPTLGVFDAAGLETALLLPEVRELIAALRAGYGTDVPILAAACTGTFVLADAGQLDGVRATTCWWLTSVFQRRYPTVGLDQSRMVLRSGNVITAGAAFAHIDLALHLVSRVSDRLAEVAARHMLVDERPSRSVSAALDHLTTTDPLVTSFEDDVRRRLHEPLDIAELADTLAVTRRTLERRVRRATGRTPGGVIAQLRLERARHLRRTTGLSMEQVARRVGYASAITLRRALARDSR